MRAFKTVAWATAIISAPLAAEVLLICLGNSPIESAGIVILGPTFLFVFPVFFGKTHGHRLRAWKALRQDIAWKACEPNKNR